MGSAFLRRGSRGLSRSGSHKRSKMVGTSFGRNSRGRTHGRHVTGCGEHHLALDRGRGNHGKDRACGGCGHGLIGRMGNAFRAARTETAGRETVALPDRLFQERRGKLHAYCAAGRYIDPRGQRRTDRVMRAGSGGLRKTLRSSSRNTAVRHGPHKDGVLEQLQERIPVRVGRSISASASLR